MALVAGLFVGRTLRSAGTGTLQSGGALLALAVGLIPALYGLVPRLGPELTGAVGGCFLLAATLNPAAPPATDTADEQPAEESIALGILVGGGLPLLVLLAIPLFGPSIPWLAEVVVGLVLGFLLVRLVARKGGLSPTLGAVLLLGTAEGVLRAPQAISWLLSKGFPAEVGGLPAAASALTILLFAIAGGAVSTRRRAGPSLLVGVLLWLVLPGLLQLEASLRVVVSLAAVASLLEFQEKTSVGRRAFASAAALLCLAVLAAPTPPRGMQAVAPYESYTDAGQLNHLLRTAAWRETERLDSPSGSLLWFRDGDTLVWWTQAHGGREDGAALASDRFFAHLPALLGSDAQSVLLLDPGAGGPLDAARKGGRTSGVVSWVRSASHRLFVQLEGPSQVSADPAVRLRVGDGLTSRRGTRYDVVLVDLPAPWQPGGSSAWSLRSITQVARLVDDPGVAVFRVPLGQVAGPTLAALVQKLAKRFSGLEAWLDPTGSEHLLLLARTQPGVSEAGAVFRAFGRRSLRQQLEPAAMRQPGDVLERFLLDRDGLLTALPESRAWSPHTSSILSGLRSRRGATVLPLAELSEGGLDLEAALDFSTVPEDKLGPLEERLQASIRTRAAYLALLEAIALGKGAEAIALAGRVAESSLDPTRDLRSLIQPWMDQGDRFVEQGLYEQAKAEYLIAVSFSPRDPDLNLRLASVQGELGELDKAKARYDDLLESNPTSLPTVLGLASILERQGKFREGATLLEEAEKLHPGEARLLVNLGALHLRLAFGSEEVMGKHIARARMLFQTAASLEPRMAHPHGGLAEVFSLLGEHERALTEINRAIALSPSCTYRGWRGQILWELGRGEEAEKELNQTLLECPEHLPALVALGGVLVDRGCYSQGREAWERALLIDDELTAPSVNLEQLELSGVEKALGDSQCQ